jgi:RHS repeat-associated protein
MTFDTQQTGNSSLCIIWNNSDKDYITDTYDSYGNIATETDALDHVTKYEYNRRDSTSTFADVVVNALGQSTGFSYDLGTGNLLWQEKNGIRMSYEYDSFGRISKEVLPYDSQLVPTKTYTYYFDGIAPEYIKVSQKTTANNTLDTYYYYDGFGNMVQMKTPSYGGKQVVKNYIYDGSSRVRAVQNAYFGAFSVNISVPSLSEKFTNYTYDALSRVVNVTNPDYTNATIVFNRWNVSTYDENNHRKDYVLDAYDRITAVKEYNIDPLLNDGVVSVYTTAYGYDAADNLVQINDTYGNQFKFTYDSLGRRTRLNDPDIGEVNYTYDLVGNLISQVGGSGNLVTGDGYYREYNALNQLTKIRNGSSATSPLLEQYYYDPFNERIKISRNDSAKTVIYTPFREFMQIRNSSGIYNFTYIYDGSTLIARINPDNNKYFYHPDQLGSTTLITDKNGNVVENTFYEPFGDVTSGGSKEVKLYTGQFSDELTDQYYYGARYYKPSMGKFIQPDPIIQQVYNPQNLNKYSYVINNPYKYIDPTGTVYWGELGKAVIQGSSSLIMAGSAVGATIGSEGIASLITVPLAVYAFANFGDSVTDAYNSIIENKDYFEKIDEGGILANTGSLIAGKKGAVIGSTIETGISAGYFLKDIPSITKNLLIYSQGVLGAADTILSASNLLRNSNIGVDRYSANGGKPIISKQGNIMTIQLAKGGKYGSATCYVASCAIKQKTKTNKVK